jgi:hypothetical protein
MTYTEPLLTVFALAGLIGLVRLYLGNRKGLLVASIAGLILSAWPPVEWLLSRIIWLLQLPPMGSV